MAPHKRASSRSEIWDFFERTLSENDKQGVVGICLTGGCKAILKCPTGSTTSLITHLRAHHVPEWEEYNKKKRNNEKLKQSADCSTTKTTKKSSSEQTTLDARFIPYKKDHPKAILLTKKIGMMMAKDFQPYTIVDDDGFRSVLQAADPRYNIPSSTTFSRSVIPKLFEVTKQKVSAVIREDLGKTESGKSVSFTTDTWKSRAGDPYMSLTCHYLTSNFEFKNHALAMRHFPKSHTGENIADMLVHVFNEWDLPKTGLPIYCLRAANVKKAFADMNGEWFEISCFAHTLQLAINDAMKATPGMQHMLDNSRAIVSFYHRSHPARSQLLLKQKQLNAPLNQLVNDVKTRWNSSYYMCQRLIQQKEALSAHLSSVEEVGNLSVSEWKMSEGLVEVLGPFEEATRASSGETYSTLSIKIPILAVLNDKLNTFISSPTRKGSGVMFARHLNNALNVRFPDYKSSFPENVATFLNPRYRDILFDEVQLLTISNCLQEKLKNMQDPLAGQLNADIGFIQGNDEDQGVPGSDEDATTGQNRDPVLPTHPSTYDSLWSSLDVIMVTIRRKNASNDTCPSTLKVVSDFQEEFERYLNRGDLPISRKDDPLAWWRENTFKFPVLANMAQEFLGIPSTSVCIEDYSPKAGARLLAEENVCFRSMRSNLCFYITICEVTCFVHLGCVAKLLRCGGVKMVKHVRSK